MPTRRHLALRAARHGEGRLIARRARLISGLRRFLAAPQADLSRLPIALDLRAISIAEGVRAALSTAVMVALAGWLGWPPLMQSALAALFTCMCDPGGPVRRRVPALLSFTFLGAVTLLAFGFLRGLGYGAIPLACLAVFCFSFLRVYGQAAQQVGALLTVVLLLALDRPWPDAATAFTMAGLFVAGSLWAVLLTLVIWRLHPYRPVRRAVADVYRALALLADDLRRTSGSGDEAAWEAHARAYRRRVREALEQARAVVRATLRQRGAQSPRAAQSLIRLETAEQLFAALIALEETLAQYQPESPQAAPGRDVAARLLRRLPSLLGVLAGFILHDEAARPARLERAIAAIEAGFATLAPGDPVARIGAAIVDRLRIAFTLSLPAGFLPAAGPDGAPPPLAERLRGPLSANLSPASAALRHAARTALVTAPALAITFRENGTYQHWLTITLVLTMQPYFAVTLQRAMERIGGTVLGGLLAALLTLICHTPWQIAGALFPLAVIALSVRTASFGLYIMLLTPLIVLLSELGHAGASGIEIAAMRAAYTLAGGLLAVAGALILWPSWEPERLAGELAAALRAHACHARAEFALLLDADAARLAAAEAARRGAGIASNNLEASLARALNEPRRGRQAMLDVALVIDAALRRVAGRLIAMRLDASVPAAEDRIALAAWGAWIAVALETLAADTAAALPPPPERLPRESASAEAIGRLARQVELIAGALQRAARQG